MNQQWRITDDMVQRACARYTVRSSTEGFERAMRATLEATGLAEALATVAYLEQQVERLDTTWPLTQQSAPHTLIIRPFGPHDSEVEYGAPGGTTAEHRLSRVAVTRSLADRLDSAQRYEVIVRFVPIP